MPALSERLSLAAGRLSAVLAPQDGGRLAEFSLAREGGAPFPLIAPLGPGPGAPRRRGCYPLVPFSNRIAGGRFCFEGELVELPPDPLAAPQALHGLGWRRPWRVRERGAAGAVLELVQAPGRDWPWGFTATQTVALDADGLSLVLQVASTDPRPQPMGLGFHPFFPLAGDSLLQLPATGAWAADAQLLPLAHGPLPRALDFRTPRRLPPETLDAVLTGWSGEAVLRWPAAGLGLRLASTPGLAVLFHPAGEGVVAIEPVSHATNALNLPAGLGPGAEMPVLAPGAALELSLRLTPFFLEPVF